MSEKDPTPPPPVVQQQPFVQQAQVQSQQAAQQQLTVQVNQPQYHGPYPQNVREFSSGICGCCEDICSCIYAWFFMPCFKCTLASNMNEFYCGPICLDKTFLVPMRTKLRTMLGIRGSICTDCLCMTFCEFCAVTQMMRELKHHNLA